MKIKACLILASVLFASVSTALSAEEEITGAFGIKLGQILSWQMIRDSELAFTHGIDNMYSFYPEKKFRSFSFYSIAITPKTRRIYNIFASGDMDDDSTCEKEQALIMAILKQKYGEVDKLSSALASLDPHYINPQIIEQGDRKVGTVCSRLPDVDLSISYSDSRLSELAENERIELESSKVDSSGL